MLLLGLVVCVRLTSLPPMCLCVIAKVILGFRSHVEPTTKVLTCENLRSRLQHT